MTSILLSFNPSSIISESTASASNREWISRLGDQPDAAGGQNNLYKSRARAKALQLRRDKLCRCPVVLHAPPYQRRTRVVFKYIPFSFLEFLEQRTPGLKMNHVARL